MEQHQLKGGLQMNRVIIRLGFAIFVGSVFVGCNVNGSDAGAVDEQIVERLDVVVTDSDVVVKGKFTELIKKENMVRSASDPSQPSEEHFSEGHIYQFQIDQAFKGSDADKINVAVPYATQVSIKGKNQDIMVEHVDYEEIDLEKEYVLFLNDLSEMEAELFSPASALFIIEIDEQEGLRFYSKRIDGQLASNVLVDEREEGFQGTYVTELSGFLVGDYTEDVLLLKDLLAEEGIETLSELEVFLEE